MCAAQQRYMTSEEKRLAWMWFEEDREDATEIADRLRRDPTSIRRFLKHGKVEAKRNGRPRALSEEQIDRLVKLVNAEVKKAAGKYPVTADFIRKRFRPKVCIRVIANALHQRGVWFHKLREKPVLTSEDVKARSAFATRYRSRTAAWWIEHVHLHVDNHVFKVPGNKATRRALAARKVHGTYQTAGRGLQSEHVKHGRQLRQGSGYRGVMVCGGVCSQGVVLWHVIDGQWCGRAAADVHSDPMRDALRRAFPEKRSFKLLEDNDPVGNRSRAGLAAKRQCRFSTLDIPKRSPNLNVMDYFLWSEVEKRLRRQERSWVDGRKETRADFIRRLKRTAARTPAHVVRGAIGNLAARVPWVFSLQENIRARFSCTYR